jgi:hypothetical protein
MEAFRQKFDLIQITSFVPVCSAQGKNVFSKGVYLTLFDPSPNKSVKDLYGREKELDETVTNLEKGRWMVLLGPEE